MLFQATVHKLGWNLLGLNSTIDLICDDIEKYLPDKKNSFDIIFCSLVFHEVPEKYWSKIFWNFKRNLAEKGTLVILDIHPDYNPSDEMLKGEPFIFEYLSRFDHLFKLHFGKKIIREDIVPYTLTKWIYQK